MLRDEILADTPYMYHTFSEVPSGNGTHTLTNKYGAGGNISLNSGALRAMLGRGSLLSGASIRSAGTETNGYMGVSLAKTAWAKAITVEIVIRPYSASGYQVPIGCDVPTVAGSTGYSMYACFNGSLTPRFRVINNAGSVVEATSSVSLSAGTAYHLIGRYDGSNVSIWVNGVKRGETAETTDCYVASSDWALFAGYFNHAITDYFLGEISDAAVYETALSDARILAHYNACIADKTVGGVAKTDTNFAADSVIVREMNLREYSVEATPDASGVWSALVPPGSFEIITYKDSYQPVCHGPIVVT